MAKGQLIVNAKKQIRVKFTNSKGKEVEMAVPAAELSAVLKREPLDNLNGREVELDEEKGQPRRVRAVGEAFAAPALASPPQPQQGRRHGDRSQQPRGGGPGPRHQRQQRETQPVGDPAFHNPYNFVPAPPRKTDHPDLGDREPVGHHCYHVDQTSGVIRVKMKLKTPLLLPDAARAMDTGNDHQSFPVRLDADGKPYLPPTSIKGMLRSAYEAVTNSRLAVFAGHEDRLAFRMDARSGINLIPARITKGQFELLTGTTPVGSQGQPNHPLHAAWLPRYDRNGSIAPWAVKYSNNALPQHGDEVAVWIEEQQHWRWDRYQSTHKPDFKYWKVRGIAKVSEPVPPNPGPSQARQKRDRQPWHEPKGNLRQVNGWVCVTNANINRKHDERVLFVAGTATNLPCDDAHRRMWRELIDNYQSIHEDDIKARRKANRNPWDYLGSEPGKTAWSRHIYTQKDRNLEEGTLCYVRLNPSRNAVEALFPVMIARELFQEPPLKLLPNALCPAEKIAQLSPADRVFGYVNQNGQGAYRGNVRMGPVTCQTTDAIENFGIPGLPLSILGQPKPQQTRFYVAQSPNGEAQGDRLDKEGAGYRSGKGLRGRKVYPHHRSLPDGHWDDPVADRTQHSKHGHFQEYRRPDSDKVRDNQNRSIQGWVKPDAEFTFDLHLTNLSQVELGALLWLLNLDPGRYHRLGGAKPLGFGSVRLEIDEEGTHLHDGNGWKEVYCTLDDYSPPQVDQQEAITAFQEAVVSTYAAGRPFEQVSFIAAFLRMAKGFEDNRPNHYPRARQQGQQDPVPPHPEGLAYQWFVANDRTGVQVSLPNLADDPGLPMLDAPRRSN